MTTIWDVVDNVIAKSFTIVEFFWKMGAITAIFMVFMGFFRRGIYFFIDGFEGQTAQNSSIEKRLERLEKRLDPLTTRETL